MANPTLGIREFHYIAPVDNLDSIFEKGILSHNEAVQHKKDDVSMDSVQEIRATKVIREELMGLTKTIHDCVNLYWNAKNPMLSTLRDKHKTLVVLRIRPAVFFQPNAVVADRNAAVKEAKFYRAAEGAQRLATNILFGEYWTSKFNTPETNRTNGQFRCAELLLPNKIHPSNIGGMYVVSETVKQAVETKFPDGCPVPITVHPAFFFERSFTPYIPPLDNKLYPNPVDFARPMEIVPESTPLAERSWKHLTHENQPSGGVKRSIEREEKDPLEPNSKKEKAEAEEKSESVQEGNTYVSPKKGIERWLVRKTPARKASDPILMPYNKTVQLPPHMTIGEGNLLDSSMQTLVNTVNCKGAMGKGIAAEFKRRHKKMFKDYKNLCDQGKVKPGIPYLYKAEEGKLILNFPTKDHWTNPSQLIWIQQGLDAIVKHHKEWGVTSLALPPLGCGNGGLDWGIVLNMIIGTLGELRIPIEIYKPK